MVIDLSFFFLSIYAWSIRALSSCRIYFYSAGGGYAVAAVHVVRARDCFPLSEVDLCAFRLPGACYHTELRACTRRVTLGANFVESFRGASSSL